MTSDLAPLHSQSVDSGKAPGEYKVNAIRVLIFVYRPLMVQLVYVHGTKYLSAFKAGKLCQVNERGACSELSLLVAGRRWFCSHPLSGVDVDSRAHFVVHDIFNATCDAVSDVLFTYSGFSMAAMFLALRSSHRPHSRVHKGVRLRSRGHPHDFGGEVHRMRAFLAEPHSLAAFKFWAHA